ncbi:hypothetical protein RND81_13G085000 [Saponaria officinalis]|uniref:Retrovirus-related Pol polyprotein from transposon TNT 1-94-like beta-barrel domain-containing protein n=1 Tax=Saponaria officinalis TaxID=3572 RepID=A0AAW1H538_SAPOF
MDVHHSRFHMDVHMTAVQQPSSCKHILDSQLVDGIVNTVMEKVYKVILDHHQSSILATYFVGSMPTSMLLSALNTYVMGKWIVDTSVSDHMTSNCTLLYYIHLLPKLILVGLPDGTVKVVNHSGILNLTPSLTLTNVLIVPDFKHNMLSVGCLVNQLHLIMFLDEHECIFRDPISKQVLGKVQKEGDLYWSIQTTSFSSAADSKTLDIPKTVDVLVNNSYKNVPIDVVHARFGHNSLDKMKHVMSNSNKSMSDFRCETCFSEHHVLPFPRSDSYTVTCFALIHIYLLGPHKTKALFGYKNRREKEGMGKERKESEGREGKGDEMLLFGYKFPPNLSY